MSMRKALCATTAFMALVVCATGVQAKALRNSLEIQGYGQWVAVDANNSASTLNPANGLPWVVYENGWGGGFSIGYNIIDWFEVEFDYSHVKNDFTAPGYRGSFIACTVLNCENKTNTFTFFGTFNIPAGEFVSPYARLGVGGFVSDNPAWHVTGASVVAGAGVRVFPIPDNGLNLRVGTDLAGFFPTTTDGFLTLGNFVEESTFNVRVIFGLGYVFSFGSN